tara:strand:+ start:224 stop:370 length:147 start_codon:yes stop_codon:yes gene_type:complete
MTKDGPVPKPFMARLRQVTMERDAARKDAERLVRKNVELSMLLDAATK